jgi:transketolase
VESKADLIRKYIVGLSYHAQSAHLGSSLSCVEILDSAFACRSGHSFLESMDIVLSKGHAAMALYASAIAYGELPESVIKNYLRDGSDLWGHPSKNEKFPFIAWSTGSLGHGLPVAVGKAFARSKIKSNSNPILVVMSDGELDEGSNWEAILAAGHHKLKNLMIIIDYNKIQSFGFCASVLDLEPLNQKFVSFGWSTFEVDGHNQTQIEETFKSFAKTDRPLAVIAHTIKGKGVSSIENTIESHYKPATEKSFKDFWS